MIEQPAKLKAILNARRALERQYPAYVEKTKRYNAETRKFALLRGELNDLMAALSGPDWSAIIATIPGVDLRCQVATIVWWDHFGDRPATEHVAELDEYLESWSGRSKVDRKDLEAALVSVGYAKHVTKARLKNWDKQQAELAAGAGEQVPDATGF